MSTAVQRLVERPLDVNLLAQPFSAPNPLRNHTFPQRPAHIGWIGRAYAENYGPTTREPCRAGRYRG